MEIVMKLCIFSIYAWNPLTAKLDRDAVVGPAAMATVEAALARSHCSPEARHEIRACAAVRDFIEGAPKFTGYGYGRYGRYATDGSEPGWSICIGVVDEVLAVESYTTRKEP
jgi:hypothetical protein